MSDFRTIYWSKKEPFKIRNSDLTRFLSFSGRFISCPVCPHSGNWTFHIDHTSYGEGGPDPYVLLYQMPAFSPKNLEKPLYHLMFVAMECPKCAHLEMLAVTTLIDFLQGQSEAARDE